MKNLLLGFLWTLLTITLQAQESSSVSKGVSVSAKVKPMSTKGKVYFSIYKEDDFLENPIKSLGSAITDGFAKVTFKNIPKGNYAIVCFHDKNSNEKMDFAPTGMPLEDYGATNNIVTFGPPQFKNAKFEVLDKDLTFEIKF